jgi:GTP-binding protein EngB required for normal cell division
MDLKAYEQIKFELAELIRAGYLVASGSEKDANKRYDSEKPWRDLLARLADDRFTVVVAGRFNRGKSSLMNAILGMDRLPTGIVPLTSVITYVRYGTSERVLLDYYGSGLRGEAKLDDLPGLVTEKGNPGNVKRIRAAEIQLPAEILRRGFFLVDTPGLGSAIFENSQTTEQFIPEIDVLILVTSYESPLTEDEIRFLRNSATSVKAIFVVVNKQDSVPVAVRQEVLEFVSQTTQRILTGETIRPFSVSARDGLAAKQANDMEALRESGILAFEDHLVRFLTFERSKLFLAAMLDRVSAAIRSLPTSRAISLDNELKRLRRDFGEAVPSQEHAPALYGESVSIRLDSRGVTPCEICRRVLHDVLDFLRQYQYDLSTQPEVQTQHAEKGGFCPMHTWQYEQIASPRGVCTAYPRLLNRTAQMLRSLAGDESTASPSPRPLNYRSCPACRVRWETEDKLVHAIATALDQNGAGESRVSPVCLPHLELLLPEMHNLSARRGLLLHEAAAMERTAEDMQRYAIKHDALRRHLVSKEENDAPLLGLQLLTGHRSVNSIFTIRDII